MYTLLLASRQVLHRQVLTDMHYYGRGRHAKCLNSVPLCSCLLQVPGLPLEDQGGPRSAASHWEYRFFNQVRLVFVGSRGWPR